MAGCMIVAGGEICAMRRRDGQAATAPATQSILKLTMTRPSDLSERANQAARFIRWLDDDRQNLNGLTIITSEYYSLFKKLSPV